MCEFYQEIALVKVWITEKSLNHNVMNILKQTTIPTNAEVATAISLLLNQWIELKRLKYKDTLTDREFQIFDKACFAMISLADELFIMLITWPGKDHWHDVLLEEQSYQSCSAGTVFYEHVEDLLNDKKHDEHKNQLAAVYLLTIRLGFAGRHRDDDSRLNDYSKKLFNIVNRGGEINTEMICIEAYQNNLSSQTQQRLAPLSNWYRGMLYSILVYSVLGAAIWYTLVLNLTPWITK